jgi:arginase family enzyme
LASASYPVLAVFPAGADHMSNSTEFSTTNPAPVLPSGNQAQPTRRIRVMGVPLDLGASRRGVDMGPSAMRVAGLEQRL